MPYARRAVSKGTLYHVVCAAPATASAHEFVSLAQGSGWDVRVIATPLGARFADIDRLSELTGDQVRSEFRLPGDEPGLPSADAVVVAPATFNTINKWAAGIADTFAVSLLCELTGFGVPILAVPMLKDALARHVAFARSIEVLKSMGIRVQFDPLAPPGARMPPWPQVLDEVHTVTRA
ncbi:MAG: flavoprotein [Streptosporangiales bacterium]|nr:flavoprotein [Streptosporangiales bacterium]